MREEDRGEKGGEDCWEMGTGFGERDSCCGIRREEVEAERDDVKDG